MRIKSRVLQRLLLSSYHVMQLKLQLTFLQYMPLPTADCNPPPTYSKSVQNATALKLTLPKPATFPYERSNPNGSQISPYNSQPLPSMHNSHLWNLPFDRPQEAVSERKSGIVLKLKLG